MKHLFKIIGVIALFFVSTFIVVNMTGLMDQEKIRMFLIQALDLFLI